MPLFWAMMAIFFYNQAHGAANLIGRWRQWPVAIVLDEKFYAAPAEARALRRAIDTWNRWAAERGRVAFTLLRPEKGAPAPPVRGCHPEDFTRSFTPAVGIWRIGAKENRRPSCARGEKLLPPGMQAETDWRMRGREIRHASVLLNFDDFHGPGKTAVDLESLLLHELGHVLGLLHSCDGSGEETHDDTHALRCDEVPAEALSAVMFPFLDPSEIRRDLQTYDREQLEYLIPGG